jgi:hypothetical protein
MKGAVTMSHPTPAGIRPVTPADATKAAAASGPAPSGPSVPLPNASAATATALCGQPHQYKTKTGETKTKPCVKAKGHAGLHSSRNQSEKVDISVLSGVSLGAEEVPTDDILDVVTDRVRSEQQLQADKDVALGHEKWLKAGKPTGFNDAIRKQAASRYVVKPEHVAAVRTLLRRAENAPGLKGKVHVKVAPPKNHVSGHKMLYFVVVDKSTKPAATTPAAAPTPAPAKK